MVVLVSPVAHRDRDGCGGHTHDGQIQLPDDKALNGLANRRVIIVGICGLADVVLSRVAQKSNANFGARAAQSSSR